MDGDQERRVQLQLDLVVQTDEGSRGGTSVVRGVYGVADGQPVFRSQSGTLMNLPGGVIVVFEPEWSKSQIQSFWSRNGIKASRVTAQEFTTNAFLVDTDPGFPSLDLANQLAGSDGVLISSPNWRVQVALR